MIDWQIQDFSIKLKNLFQALFSGDFVFCPTMRGFAVGTWKNFCNAVLAYPSDWTMYGLIILIHIIILYYLFKHRAKTNIALRVAFIFSIGIWIYFISAKIESYRNIPWWEGTNRPWIFFEFLISFYLSFVVYGVTHFFLKFHNKNH